MQVVGDELDRMTGQSVAQEVVTQVVQENENGISHHHAHFEQQKGLDPDEGLDSTVLEKMPECFQKNLVEN